MTDGQWLFLTFLALYLVESLRWLPPQSVLLTGHSAAGGWRWRPASARFQFRGRAAVFLPLLPPLRAWRITCPWRWVPEPDGLRVKAEDSTAPDRLLPWADLHPRAEDSTLWLTRHHSLPAATPAEAEHLAAQAQAWQSLTPEQRAAAFTEDALRQLCPAQARQDAAEAARQTRALRLLGSVILVWSYGGITWLYWRLGESAWLLGAVAGLFLLMLAQALLFARACRKSLRQHQRPVPWWKFKTLGILLFPPMAIRAADHLLALSPAPQHPLAAIHLVPERDWQTAALRLWRQTRYCPGWQTAAPGSDLELDTLRRFFDREKADIPALDTPPPATAQDTRYCPRCHALFTDTAATCADCGGVELARFPTT